MEPVRASLRPWRSGRLTRGGNPPPRKGSVAPIKLVTDSGADLLPAIAEKHAIGVVDLDVRLGEVMPEVTKGWTAEEFWQHCANSSVLPETSAPSPGAFKAAFTAAASEGAAGVVCVTLSSKLSATYQSACAGAAEMSELVPVRVVDSLSVTMGQGLMVLSAAEAAGAGAELEEVVSVVEDARDKVRVYGTLDTLDNLRKGGRIGGAQAFFGSLLAVKPVIEVREGVVEPESRQRTRTRSLQYLASKVTEAGELDEVAVVHAGAPDVEVVVDLIGRKFPRDRILVSHIGPVIGTHAGARSVGACFKLK
jgi:DegV family protein with EDD domain